MRTGTEGAFSAVFVGAIAIASIVGIVWLWVNAGDGSLLARIIIVGALGAGWICVVFAVAGLLVVVLGLVGVAVRPFWRR